MNTKINSGKSVLLETCIFSVPTVSPFTKKNAECACTLSNVQLGGLVNSFPYKMGGKEILPHYLTKKQTNKRGLTNVRNAQLARTKVYPAFLLQLWQSTFLKKIARRSEKGHPLLLVLSAG